MNILVCFKTVPELEKVIPSDWQHFMSEPDISYVGNMLGCFDEAALETALRLKDEKPDCFCTALSFGRIPGNQCKKIYAAGFNKVVCLESDESEFSPVRTAERLSEYISTHPQSLVVCGSCSPLWDSGTVPYYLAKILNLPLISDVRKAEWDGENIKVLREREGVTDSCLLKPPLLLLASDPALPLRFASLRAQLAAGKMREENIAAAAAEKIKFRLLKQKASECRYMENNPEELAEELLKMAEAAGK